MSRTEDWMASRLPELAAAAIDRCARDIPFYRALPRDLVETEVTAAFTNIIGLIARTLRQDRAPNSVELTEIIDWSARRAADGLPLDAALSAYLIASRECFAAVADADPDGLARYGDHSFRFLASVVPAVVLAHLHEQQQIEGHRRDLRRDLVTALLAGEPAADLAEQSGVRLAPAYLVVLLRLAPGPADARPTVRRVQAALDAHQRSDVLAALAGEGGTVLLPASPDARLDGLVARVAKATGRAVTAAVADAPALAAIPAAVREAREVADLVRRLDRPPGLYRLDDVLLEYQLARPGPALSALAAKLDPLDDRPVLLETVLAFVRHGHNRSRTAAELSIHRNTLDYRLAKAAAFMDVDLGDPGDLRVLDAAATARALA
ncbi:PucR family transcriptional regulator [Actinomadura atramentaria]|uniref:PucR family transcriptional regulator n=1 Tax=Actinomadura atramentaria TaxID=1990 RepID=UPI00036C8760|nr:helix-turn-helix domain-containing protein [Actinomadura atramentaria]